MRQILERERGKEKKKEKQKAERGKIQPVSESFCLVSFYKFKFLPGIFLQQGAGNREIGKRGKDLCLLMLIC